MKQLNDLANFRLSFHWGAAHSGNCLMRIPELVLVLLLITAVYPQDLYVTPSSPTINQVASYSFTVFQLNVFIPNGAIVAITFPQQYNSSALHSLRPYSGNDVGGGDLCWPADCSAVTISYSGFTFTLSGIFDMDYNAGESPMFQYTIFNIKNPSRPGTVGTYSMTIYSGSTIHYPSGGPSTSLGPSFTAKTMVCSTQVVIPTIWSTSPLKITITPNSVVDTIQFTLANIFPIAFEPVRTQTFTSTLTCFSLSNPYATCSYVSGGKYEATNLYYSTAGTSIDITLQSMYTPSSLTSLSLISVSTKYNGSITDSCSITIPATSFTNDILRQLTSTVTYLPSDQLKINISFSVSQTSLPSDVIFLTFPSDFTMPTTPASYQVIIGLGAITTTYTFYPANRTVSFRPYNISGLQTGVQIIVTGLARPRQCKFTGTFALRTYRFGLYLMDSNTCCSIQLQNRQNLTSNGITLSNSIRLASNVSYTFNFSTLVVNLDVTDMIKIQFPSSYSGYITAANSSTICSGLTVQALNNASNVKSNITCSVQLNTILISSFLNNIYTSSQTFVIKITGLTNPSTSPADNFSFATLSTNGYVLEQVTGVPVTITTSQLTNFSVSLSSYVTCTSNVLYTFAIGNNGALSNGYVIMISFPADIYFINYNTMVCKINGGSVPCARTVASYSTSTHVINVFVNSSIGIITSLSISSVTNPYSTVTTASFSAVIMDSSGQSVETSNGATTISMLSAGTFLSYLATTTNYTMASSLQLQTALINQQTTTLYLTMVLPYSLINGSTMTIIIFNSSYIQSFSNNCTSPQFSPTCICSVNATSNNLEVAVSAMTFSGSASNFININLNNVLINDYRSIQITTTLFANGYSSLSLSPVVSLSLMFMEAVSSYTITQSSYILGMASTVNISMTLSAQALLQLSYFLVFIPLEYGASNYSVTVINASLIGSTIVLSGLTNPTTIAYTPFLFTAYNNNNNPIAFSLPNNSSNTYGFRLNCTLPCKDCSGSACMSCYNSISWIRQIYWRSSNQSCAVNCVQGEYLNNYTCLPCNTNCLTCQMYGSNFSDGSSTTCLTCLETQYLLGGVCYSSCPSGYYNSSPICVVCMSNCLNCTAYNTCTACQTSYSLYNFQCISVCPISTISITNNLTLQSVCVNCPSNCLTCSIANSSMCLTCNSGYYLSNGACGISCVLPLYLSWNGLCSTCQTQCLTCSTYSYNCTSCSALLNLYLYKFQCLGACPSGTYPASNICVVCPTNCSVCSSAGYCSICTLPSALYVLNGSSSSCVATCPNGTTTTINTTSLKYQCQACATNCASCSISVSYCLTCQANYVQHNYTCISNCSSVSLYLINNSCRNCTPECRSCRSSDPYNCSLCSPNYFLFNFGCIQTCPNGTYPNISLLTCSPCFNSCLTCQTTPGCTSCAIGFLFNASCHNNCSSLNSLNQSYFPYNTSCLICQPQCEYCLSSPFECTNCSNSMYYYTADTHNCSYNCSASYYADGMLCVACLYPCLTCDTAYDSCTSCNTTLANLSLINGTCIASCPSTYYSVNSTCVLCPVNCSTCNSTRCLTCLPYAYVYHTSCVLNCAQTADLPITIDNYCTNCASVSNCHACTQTVNKDYLCFLCIYPYVVFEGNCLNVCPNLYVANSNAICVKSPEYAIYMENQYRYNTPIIPPFMFLVIFLVTAGILYLASGKSYRYTYHCGYLIALYTVVQTIFLCYGIIYLQTRYQGDYMNENKPLPLYIIAASFCTKLVFFNILFYVLVLCYNYLKDARYKEWFECHRINSILMIILISVFGCRFHKLYYSKAFGRSIFSYRIVSVQKFYQEDVLNWLLFVPDLLDISAFAIVTYNIFMQYSVLYLFLYELILLKTIVWCLIVYDMKKPDRGFFFGDEEEAERQIKIEIEERQAKKRKFQMENLAKLIRRKSATELFHQKLYDPLYIEDFRSVFDPSDYEDVPVVPNRKIEKAINKGKFRKGKRITIEEKLKRFAESIKPTPVVAQDNGYLKGLIYWKPPKMLKTQKKRVQPMQSEESMMKMLEDKQFLYKEELNEFKIQDLDDERGIEQDSRARYADRRRKRLTFMGDADTIPDDTLDHFYEPGSIEILQPQPEGDFNGMLNLNYARRKHLPQKQLNNRFDEQQLRVLDHKPLKKRASKRMNEISIRHI